MHPGDVPNHHTPFFGSAERSPNRLIHEKSPYLLQHAYNPVNWYPWGDEAFARAAAENKPVFLSIGYSTCHWCHVMARESFENENVAAILNREFVSIKVDREERPDIDSVYMGVCQQMTGRGGWPLTIVMTAEKKPFFAGTYFPRENTEGMVGLTEILLRIAALWCGQRDELYRAAEEISRQTQPVYESPSNNPGRRMLDAGFQELCDHFDNENGGFGSAPKFPAPHVMVFLFRYWYLTGETRARTMAEQTLGAMCGGGIWDQLGAGLHRYATDAQWRVPHFEKMLTDQALLVIACAEAYEATRDARYRITAEECITYVLRDLRDPGGAFYAAEDADSPGGEGAYYSWTKEEIIQVLGPEEAAHALNLFNLMPIPDTSAVSRHMNGDTTHPRCVLSAAGPDPVLAHTLHITEREVAALRDNIRCRLLSARQGRRRPARDTKILTDTNALFCIALARAGRVFDNPEYINAASSTLQFISLHLRDDKGGLLHRYYGGESGIRAFADDYVYLVSACIELYRATFEIAYLREAIEFNTTFLRHFRDAKNGGFFTIPDTAVDLPVRKKEWYDGSIPSANAVAFENLMQLYRLSGDAALEEEARACARFIAGTAARSPSAVAGFLAALACSFQAQTAQDLVIAGDLSEAGTRAFLDAIRSRYFPGLMVVLRPPGTAGTEVDIVAPVARCHNPPDREPMAYLCSSSACLPPVSDAQELLRLLDGEREKGSRS